MAWLITFILNQGELLVLEAWLGRAFAGDSDEAHEELIERLRAAVTRRRWRQADLARHAGVSTAAVSNIFNGKGLPSIATLQMLCRALRTSEAEATELMQLRRRAEARSGRVRWLDAYLRAAQRAAQEQPYPGVLPGLIPPLTSVYVRQQALLVQSSHSESYFSETGDSSSHEVRVGSFPADEMLAGGRSCVVVGDPGGGKSSLLRIRWAAGVERWLNGAGDDLLPVLVEAAELSVGPLPRALATAVTGRLASYGLLEDLSVESFAQPPPGGSGWMVLVDGLDEVADAAVRQRILSTLSTVIGDQESGLYKFVVATRPLPAYELDPLISKMPLYELQSFKLSDLGRVALGWFEFLGMPNPGAFAERLFRALINSSLASMARVPLMTAMICQLYAAAPERTLPGSRGELYHQFVDLLREHQYGTFETSMTRETTGSRPYGLERYGPAAAAQAEHAKDCLVELIGHLAAERWGGSIQRSIEIIESQPDASKPKRVTSNVWRNFLQEGMRGSGLLTLRKEELVFLHQTLLEHLAARYATRNMSDVADAIQEIFAQDRWGSERDLSYVGFIIDSIQMLPAIDGDHYLSSIVPPPKDLNDIQYLLDLHRLGTAVPATLVADAKDLCARLVTDRGGDARTRINAMQLMFVFGDPRGSDLYYDLTTDPALQQIIEKNTLISYSYFDYEGEMKFLARVIADNVVEPGVEENSLLRAAMEVADMGDDRAAHVLNEIANNAAFSFLVRIDAAIELAEMGDSRASILLDEFANQSSLDQELRDRAANWLRSE